MSVAEQVKKQLGANWASLAILITFVVFYLDMQRRVSNLEGQFDVVRELIVRQIATQTITTTATITGVVWNFCLHPQAWLL